MPTSRHGGPAIGSRLSPVLLACLCGGCALAPPAGAARTDGPAGHGVAGKLRCHRRVRQPPTAGMVAGVQRSRAGRCRRNGSCIQFRHRGGGGPRAAGEGPSRSGRSSDSAGRPDRGGRRPLRRAHQRGHRRPTWGAGSGRSVRGRARGIHVARADRAHHVLVVCGLRVRARFLGSHPAPVPRGGGGSEGLGVGCAHGADRSPDRDHHGVLRHRQLSAADRNRR